MNILSSKDIAAKPSPGAGMDHCQVTDWWTYKTAKSKQVERGFEQQAELRLQYAGGRRGS